MVKYIYIFLDYLLNLLSRPSQSLSLKPTLPGGHCRNGEISAADRRRPRGVAAVAAHGLDLLLDSAADVVGEVEVVAGGAARRSRR